MKLQALLTKEAKERKVAAMGVNCPRKLNLNLPLLSTRRLGSSSSSSSSSSFSSYTWKSQVMMVSDRVPFSWEHAAGKPKIVSTQPDETEDITPRPRLPPCRWQPDKAVSGSGEGRNNIGHKVDVVDEDHHNRLEASSMSCTDVVEELSLTEAIDIAQKAESHDGLINLECSRDSNHSSCASPNFMIERFLPDATAIAAASSLLYNSLPNNNVTFWNNDDVMEKPTTVEEDQVSLVSTSPSPRKGCGLEMFHPWRMKLRLCGMSSPRKEVSSTVPSRKPKLIKFPHD